MDDPDKGDLVTPCMDLILNLRIVVRGDLNNKKTIGDTWDPTASMRTLKYFLADSAKHKSRVHQLDFI